MPSHQLIDTYRHQGLRRKLTELLRDKGIRDENVLNAINTVPRHFFFDSSFLEFAYEDKAFPIGSGQTISQPFTVAFQTELLQVKPTMRVLEIGTGSGYQSCILAEIGAKVYTIERQKLLYEKTKLMLPKMSFRIRPFYGDGYKGLPAHAPFDRILITAAAPYIPEPLVAQLKVGGIMVVPVGEEIQIMHRLRRVSETEVVSEQHGSFRFVPMLSDKAKDI
jgi:protein-L-isoaspartate(D-aspartate) O-methyltransferase